MLALLLAGCDDSADQTRPPPQTITPTAIGHYCGMLLTEHPGPKGQILLRGQDQPVWFSSARDALAFTRLPEEPKEIAAVYVTDMAKESNWDNPQPNAWVEARHAWFVIGSDRLGGMGVAETVPFSNPDAARDFAARYGGAVIDLARIPDDYLLGGGRPSPQKDWPRERSHD